MLFQPVSSVMKPGESTTLLRSDVDIRKKLFANVVLSGGTTRSKGLVHDGRIDGAATPSMKIKVVAPPERKYSV